MGRTLVAVGLSGVLGLTGSYLVLADTYPHEGPYVTIAPNHGIYVGDVAIVGIWAVISAGLWRWARAARRQPAR